MNKEEIISLIKPIIIAKVLEIKKHPNADRLSIVHINLGGYTKDIITGADNFKIGDFVPYLGENNIIPGYLLLEGEKVVLQKKMLRGIESDSMILAEDEIGLSKDHGGIFILNDFFKTDFKDQFTGKSIIEILNEEIINKIVENQKKTSLVIELGDELLDLVDEKDRIIGTVLRSAAHKNSAFIHREVLTLIFNSKKQTLFQQRSFNKDTGAGKWRVACAGHLQAGENPIEGIKREVKEELGIDVNPIFLETQFFKSEDKTDSKFFWIYYAFYESNDFHYDRAEVNDLKWINLNDLELFFKQNNINLDKIGYTTTIRVAKQLKLIE